MGELLNDYDTYLQRMEDRAYFEERRQLMEDKRRLSDKAKALEELLGDTDEVRRQIGQTVDLIQQAKVNGEYDKKFAEKDKERATFPEHTHIWTVVEIENNPVGVACKICETTLDVGGVAELNLTAGQVYRTRGTTYEGNDFQEVVEVSQTRVVANRFGISRIEVHFQIHGDPQVPFF